MKLGKQAVVILALLGSVAVFSGCGGSPADQAAQSLLDISQEAKSLSEDPANLAKAMELLPKMMEAATKLEAEVKKMSPAEQEAFKKKWEPKFKAVGMDEFGS